MRLLLVPRVKRYKTVDGIREGGVWSLSVNMRKQ